MMRKILFALCLMLSSCTTPGIDIPEPAQVLNVAMIGSFETLEPACVNPPPSDFLAQVFEGLARQDEMNKPSPGLAKSWDIDGNKITFHLDDRKFSDGTALTSGHVADSLEMLAKTDSSWVVKNIPGFNLYSQGRSASIEGIEVVDDKTVAIRTNDAPEHFLLKLASPYASIWKAGDQFPVGTGVFAIKKFVPDLKVILEPNAHHPGKTKLRQVNFIIRNTYETAFEDFRYGRIHATRISGDLVAGAYGEAGASVFRFDENAIIGIGFNCKSAKFKKASNRIAVMGSINAPRLNEEAFASMHNALQPPSTKAMPDFKEMTIMVPRLLGEKLGESLKGQVEKNLGIKATISTLDHDAYIKALDSGKVECFVFGLMPNTPDPYEFYSFPMTSEIFRNALGYDFSAYSRILREMASSGNRINRLAQAREILEKDAPFFGVLGLNSFGCVWNSVEGFLPQMFLSGSFANVSIRR